MAASQARFLSLTARKSNVEYEGQQVNQQRTILANQTATLNNQMLELAVPTPPDVNQYYTEQYIFQDGDKTCEIISGLERESMVVRETEKQYNFYRQPCNSGLPVTLSLVNAQLMLNGKELNAYNAAASRAQIKSILDSGQAGDQPTFRCYVDNYNALDENDSKITDPKVLKYTNKTSEITLPLEENSDFESNFKNGIPSYSVTTDTQTGKTVYTRLTDENYEAEMAKASTEDSNVKIVQETRDKNGNPEKVLLTQAEVDNTTGLELFVGNETQKIYKEYDPEKNQGEQQYASMTKFSDAEYNKDTLAQAIKNKEIILLKKVEDASNPDGYKYEIIKNSGKYDDAVEEGAEIVQLVSGEGAGEMHPISEDCAESLSTSYGYKTKVLSSETVVEQSFDLTQEMWNQAKATNNQELMDFYIENLDFTSEYASNNILYWYDSGSGKRFIQASYIDNAGLDAENTACAGGGGKSCGVDS